MSTIEDIETGRSPVSDNAGLTRVPKSIREAKSWDKGTTLKWVMRDGEVRVVEDSQ